MKKTLLAVALSLAASAASAQTVMTVAEFHRGAKQHVDTTVQLSGVAYNIRQEIKHRGGRDVPYTSMNLYELDGKGRKGKYYVYVSIPTSSLKGALAEGDAAVITGAIHWPYQVGRMDD